MELLRRLAITTLVVGIALCFTFLPLSQAQCNWENFDCTPTPEPTPTGTITATATAQLTPVVFQPPQYDVPTSIPPLAFPTAPQPLEFTPIAAPSAISIEITPIPAPSFSTSTITIATVIPLSALTTTIDLSYTEPLTLDLSLIGSVTGTDNLTGSVGSAVGDFSGWLEDGVLSYTNYLTGQIATIQGTQTITILNAPSWYAPAMPRPMADVGWTFEQLTDPTGEILNFTLSSWASFFGYVSTLPFQMVKSLWQIVAYLGPFGLFLGWLLIMFVIVLVVHFQVFIVKFLITIIRLVVRIVEVLGEWIPTGG